MKANDHLSGLTTALANDIRSMEVRCYKLSESNDALIEQVARLKASLDAARADAPLQELLAQLKHAKAEVESLRRQLARAETERAELLDQRSLWAEKHG